MTRKEAIKTLQELWRETNDPWYEETYNMAIKALEQEPCDDMGEVSDGYHTFNQLYHQRAVLFATIVNQNKDKSWKSFRHSDGNYCFDSNGEWFIVGIDTPQGSYTYHYSKEYWNMFDCEELEFGKEWDGHTEEDVTRLLSLEQEPKCGKWVLDEEVSKKHIEPIYVCSACKNYAAWGDTEKTPFCPNCGARMESIKLDCELLKEVCHILKELKECEEE